MNEIDRKIAERLGYALSEKKGTVLAVRQSADGFDVIAEFWSEHIDKALALVEELGIDCLRLGFDNSRREWQAWTLDTPEDRPFSADIGVPAQAVAAAILTWLEVKSEVNHDAHK